MRDKAHIVKRISVDLETDEGTPFEERSKVITAFQSDLKNELEKVMDEFCGIEEVIRIDQLKIDLGNIGKNEFGTQFIDEFRKILRESIVKIRSEGAMEINEQYPKSSSAIANSPSFKKNTEDRKFDALLFFLSNGGFPWWTPFETFAELEVFTQLLLKESKVYLERLKAELFNSTISRERFVSAFQIDLVMGIAKLFFPNSYSERMSVIKFVERIFQKQLSSNENLIIRRRIGLAIDTCFEKSVNNVQLITRFIKLNDIKFNEQSKKEWLDKDVKIAELNRQINDLKVELDSKQVDAWYELVIKEISVPGDKKTLEQVKKIEKEVSSESLENIRLNYAGVVIATPFIKILFDDRNLLENNTFKDESCQWKGVQILNYLVSGNEDLEEHEMPLNKLLCGIHPELPVIFLDPLTKEDRSEVDKLLDHIINSWGAMKNTSKEGLRTSFIKRPGLLEEKETTWFLKVEQMGVDILMSRIPWGYNMIKLPWTEKLIEVEW